MWAVAIAVVCVVAVVSNPAAQEPSSEQPVAESTTVDPPEPRTDRSSQPEHPLTLSFLDVGQADALMIQKGELDILVDAGRHYSGALQSAMETITDSVDLMVITHPHADHYGGAAGILDDHDVDRIVTNGERRGPPRDTSTPVTWRRFEEAVDNAELELETWSRGDEIELTPHLAIDVLASGGDFDDTSSGTDINNDSLVMMVEYQRRRILLTGDVEIAGGKQLVDDHCHNGADDCPELRADIFQVPHHGSHHFHPPFFDAADADWAVFGAPHDNRQHHHPRKETLDAVVDRDMRVKSTNQQGGRDAVATIDIDGDVDWNIDDPEIFVWRTDDEPHIGKTCQISTEGSGVTTDCDRDRN